MVKKMVDDLAERVCRFYELSHKGNKVTEQTARSWYYRGEMSMSISNNEMLTEQFLLKDYKYCSMRKKKERNNK